MQLWFTVGCCKAFLTDMCFYIGPLTRDTTIVLEKSVEQTEMSAFSRVNVLHSQNDLKSQILHTNTL